MSSSAIPANVANLSQSEIHNIIDTGNDGKASREDADKFIKNLEDSGRFSEEDIKGVSDALKDIKGDGLDLNAFKAQVKDITNALNVAQVNSEFATGRQFNEETNSTPTPVGDYKDAIDTVGKALLAAIKK